MMCVNPDPHINASHIPHPIETTAPSTTPIEKVYHHFQAIGILILLIHLNPILNPISAWQALSLWLKVRCYFFNRTDSLQLLQMLVDVALNHFSTLKERVDEGRSVIVVGDERNSQCWWLEWVSRSHWFFSSVARTESIALSCHNCMQWSRWFGQTSLDCWYCHLCDRPQCSNWDFRHGRLKDNCGALCAFETPCWRTKFELDRWPLLFWRSVSLKSLAKASVRFSSQC